MLYRPKKRRGLALPDQNKYYTASVFTRIVKWFNNQEEKIEIEADEWLTRVPMVNPCPTSIPDVAGPCPSTTFSRSPPFNNFYASCLGHTDYVL